MALNAGVILDGGSEMVPLSNGTLFPTGSTQTAVTLEALIKPNPGLSGYQHVMAAGLGDIGFSISTGPYAFRCCGWMPNGTINEVSVDKAALLLDGNYHRYSVQIETSGSNVIFTYFLDGQLVGSKTISNGASLFTSSSASGMIGNALGGGYGFRGNIDDVRIWAVKRTQAQIQATMFSELTGNETGLLSYSKLDEGYGTTSANVVRGGPTAYLMTGVVWAQPAIGVSLNFDTKRSVVWLANLNADTIRNSYRRDGYDFDTLRTTLTQVANIFSDTRRETYYPITNYPDTSRIVAQDQSINFDTYRKTIFFLISIPFDSERRTYQEISLNIDSSRIVSIPIEVDFDTIRKIQMFLFPFEPNWREGISERIGYLTDVFTAYDDSEQRIQLRDLATRTFEYDFDMDAHEMALFDAILWGWQSKPFMVPIWTDAVWMTADTSVGSKLIPLQDTAYRDFSVGGFVAIWSDADTYEINTITELGPDYIRLELPTERDWKRDTAKVIPVQRGYMIDKPKINHPTSTATSATVVFEMEVIPWTAY